MGSFVVVPGLFCSGNELKIRYLYQACAGTLCHKP